MKKRVFIVHGWGANSGDHWFPWLKRELEARGFEVHVPDMPDTNHPKRELWLSALATLVGAPDKNTYFVGHSIGANVVLRYLQSLQGKKVGGVVLVAPYYGVVSENIGREKEIADSWLRTPIDFGKVKEATGNFTAIFSDNDDAVPLANKDFFLRALAPAIVIEHNKGHFNTDGGVTKLPSALEAVLSFH